MAVRILCDFPLSRLFDGEGPLLPALPLEEFEALATKLPVRSASGPCSTVIEKSAWVRTQRPSAVQVKIIKHVSQRL